MLVMEPSLNFRGFPLSSGKIVRRIRIHMDPVLHQIERYYPDQHLCGFGSGFDFYLMRIRIRFLYDADPDLISPRCESG
jgi:hypothetical protein